MIRKMLLVAAAAAMPMGFVAATAGTASAKAITLTTTGVDATCTLSGGTIAFHYGIGVAGVGTYVPPTKNKGQKIAISGVNLTCTSPAVPLPFTGTAKGKLKSTNPTESASTFYSATSILGNDPSAGGTLSGSLKVKWVPPAGYKFSAKTSVLTINSTNGGTTTIGSDTYGSFTIPGTTPGSITGAFAGTDNGASATTFVPTAQDEAALTTEATTAPGITSITLGTGTASLQ